MSTQIGKGGFGKIIKTEYDGREIAMKIIEPTKLSFVEVDILTRLRSPFLIRSVSDEFIQTSDGIQIPIELKENNLVRLGDKLSNEQLKRIFSSLIYGLECMHKRGFLHLDIKPGNCLYLLKDDIYHAYLSDFGFSIRCRDPYVGISRNNRVGSIRYFPYETLVDEKPFIYNDKSDVWSLGLTFLHLLGFNYRVDIRDSDTSREKYKKIREFWKNFNHGKELSFLLSARKFNDTDTIDIYQLLKEMLKLDPDERLSSKDFVKTRFLQSNPLENSCHIENPKEVLYIPYSSSSVVVGIKQLRGFFRHRYSESPLEVFFLAIEIFTRVMAKMPMDITDQTLQRLIQGSFYVSIRYYGQDDMSQVEKNKFEGLELNMINLLNGEIAPNRFFDSSEYLQDLVLVNHLLLSSYNFISFYNYIDVSKILIFFRNSYDYGEKIPITGDLSCRDLFESNIPDRITDDELRVDSNVFDSTDLREKITGMSENVSEIRKYEDIEINLYSVYLTNFVFSLDQKFLETLQKFKEMSSGDMINYYWKNFRSKGKKVCEILYKIFNKDEVPEGERIKMGIIQEEESGDLKITGDPDSVHFIFFNIDDESSLLVRESDTVTHYFSRANNSLLKYYLEKNINYKEDFKLQTECVCKINEICFFFMIFFDLKTGMSNYNIYYIKDSTLLISLASAEIYLMSSPD